MYYYLVVYVYIYEYTFGLSSHTCPGTCLCMTVCGYGYRYTLPVGLPIVMGFLVLLTLGGLVFISTQVLFGYRYIYNTGLSGS